VKNKIIILFVLALFVSSLGFAGEQPKTTATKSIILSGKIIDTTNNEQLAGVKIACSNGEKVFYTDLDGNFFIYLEVNSMENLTLEISQIGYSNKALKLQDLQANSGKLIIDLQAE